MIDIDAFIEETSKNLDVLRDMYFRTFNEWDRRERLQIEINLLENMEKLARIFKGYMDNQKREG